MVCIAPRYTSAVASFCRLLGQIAAVASPYMIGYIVQKGTKEEWKIAFYVMTIVLFVCGASFQFFGSGLDLNIAFQKNLTIQTFK